MPTPDRTTLDKIVLAGRDLLEQDGLPGLTMQAVAQRVGVRAPSLYKRVRNRDQLVQLVAESALADLAEQLNASTTAHRLLNTFRAFGLANPAAFRLVLTPGSGTPSVSADSLAGVTTGILRVAEELAGPADALEAARTLTAWAAGFVSMELNGAFKLGGDLDRAWDFGVRTIVAAMTAPPPSDR